MSCRGVFFAMTADQAAACEAAADDEELMELIEAIEEEWDTLHLAECDKSWDAMHRLLTDGQLAFGNESEPLSQVVLGPNQLHEGDDYLISLVLPDQVKKVAAALSAISKAWFDERYRTVVPADYAPEYGDVDREYTWEYFQEVRELYRKAAEENRAVLFTVDQ